MRAAVAKDCSTCVKRHDDVGTVDRVLMNRNADGYRFIKVSCCIDIDVAVPDTRLDYRNASTVNHTINESRSTARNDHIDQTPGTNQLINSFMT